MQVLQTIPNTTILPGTLPTFRVGGIPVYGDAILAPMDGFSDWPFRSICRGLGSAMSYNEFTRGGIHSARVRAYFRTFHL